MDKKSLTKFYNINQDLKTIFSLYNMIHINDGNVLCVSDKNGYMLQTGRHFAHITDTSVVPKYSDITTIESAKFYKFFSNYKKYITGLSVKDNDIVIMSNGIPSPEYTDNIGYIPYGNINIDSYLSNDKFETTIDEMLNEFKPHVTLTDMDVELLVKNNYHILRYGNYVTRITRELIPGLKKNHVVDAMFRQTVDNKIYECIIRCKRATVTSYHVYRCLNI